MTSRRKLSVDDKLLFRQAVADVRKLTQDKIVPVTVRKKIGETALRRELQEQADQSAWFSDAFQPLLSTEGPVCFIRPDVHRYEIKKLRRGDYTPDIFLDLHGLNQHQARQALGALLVTCRRENIACASIMHGHGKNILKQQIPFWLAQHPHVTAFHQAPDVWGGNAALLVLIDTGPDEEHPMTFSPPLFRRD